MKYDFLIDSYDTEVVKVLSVWSEFRDEDLPARPKPAYYRGDWLTSALEGAESQPGTKQRWQKAGASGNDRF